jgi:opacity protein-like surface antigen
MTALDGIHLASDKAPGLVHVCATGTNGTFGYGNNVPGGYMRRWKMSFFGCFLMFTACAAQAQREFEITPFAGTRFGGYIDLSQQGNPNVDSLKIKSSVNYGIMGDVTFWQNFQGEFMWNRQPTSLSSHNPNDNTYAFLSNMNLDMYQFDVLYQFLSPDSKLRPFVVGGLGFSHFGVQSVGGQSILPFSNRFAYNIGGGVKYFLSDHWGLRAEIRWSPSHTTQGLATYCDPYFGCGPTTVSNKAEQGQANIGVIYRFRK